MLAGVMAMYSGESMTFATNLTNPVYTVLGNTSNMDGLVVDFTNGNITISSDPMMKADNFTLVFFDEVTKEVIKTVYTGGGSSGGSTKYVDKNVTVYKPIYFNRTITKEVEVEKIIKEVEYVETGFKLWQMISVSLMGLIVGLLIFRPKPKEELEETTEEEDNQ